MKWAVFKETLRRDWHGMLFWGLGIGLLGFLQVSMINDVTMLQQVTQVLETLPSGMVRALVGDDVSYMATPEGYLSVRFFLFVVMVFAFYAVLAGLSVTANDEDKGILDVVLSTPVPRHRLITEKVMAHTLLILGVMLLSFVLLCLGIVVTPALAIRFDKLVISMVNVLPSTLLVLSVAVFAGAAARRKGMASAAAAIFVIASFFVDFIGQAAPETPIGALRVLSFISYYDNTGVMKNGLSLVNVAVPLVAAAVLVAGGVWCFNRRDISV